MLLLDLLMLGSAEKNEGILGTGSTGAVRFALVVDGVVVDSETIRRRGILILCGLAVSTSEGADSSSGSRSQTR